MVRVRLDPGVIAGRDLAAKASHLKRLDPRVQAWANSIDWSNES
jgi:hypothetical protein